MLIRLGYDIQFEIPAAVAMVALLNVHPSRSRDLLEPDELQTEPRLEITHYIDGVSEIVVRGSSRLRSSELFNSTLIRIRIAEQINLSAHESAVGDLHEMLSFCSTTATVKWMFSTIALERNVQPAGPCAGHLQLGTWLKVAFNLSAGDLQRPLLMCSLNAVTCAATFSIWRSPSVVRSTFRRAMPPNLPGRHRRARETSHGLQRMVQAPFKESR